MNSLSTLKALLTILSGLSVIISPSTIGRDIVFPRAQSDTDHRTNFPTTLLTKILAQSSAEDKLVPTKFYAQQDRALKLLADKEIDILWTATSIGREREFRPIRIPIYRGLLGWRIALINAQNSNLLAQQIESGFVSLIENGEYEKLFQQFVRRSLDSAEIGSRTRVRLHNPYFPVIEEKYKDYFMPF